MPLDSPVRPEEAWSSEEALSHPRLPSSYCCEFIQGFFLVVVLMGLWLPIMSVFSFGFTLPLVFGFCARFYFDRASARRKPGNGRDAFIPCHCLRGQQRVARKVWHLALAGRLQQNFEVIPVRLERGNAHAKIVNRPACCFPNCYEEGRVIVRRVVDLFVDMDRSENPTDSNGVNTNEIVLK